MIARWKPVHLGHAAILRALCDQAASVLIGIGSANRYNVRNPFTLAETQHMLQRVLDGQPHAQIIPVPDLDDGPRWRDQVIDLFGTLDVFVTDNPYVASLLKDTYHLIRPVELVPEPDRIAVDGSLVRREMARAGDWQRWVPDAVARYITENQLDERFRREFGLQTLALESIIRK
jgi:nicotinamide-nucleotide adenylyltransferase